MFLQNRIEERLDDAIHVLRNHAETGQFLPPPELGHGMQPPGLSQGPIMQSSSIGQGPGVHPPGLAQGRLTHTSGQGQGPLIQPPVLGPNLLIPPLGQGPVIQRLDQSSLLPPHGLGLGQVSATMMTPFIPAAEEPVAGCYGVGNGIPVGGMADVLFCGYVISNDELYALFAVFILILNSTKFCILLIQSEYSEVALRR